MPPTLRRFGYLIGSERRETPRPTRTRHRGADRAAQHLLLKIYLLTFIFRFTVLFVNELARGLLSLRRVVRIHKTKKPHTEIHFKHTSHHAVCRVRASEYVGSRRSARASARRARLDPRTTQPRRCALTVHTEGPATAHRAYDCSFGHMAHGCSKMGMLEGRGVERKLERTSASHGFASTNA